MDIKWKVQVLDKMFDDTYVRNLYLKMKYNTLGRFSFDIRDFGTVEVESYFAVGNTIRIFWGDILKMEGVIQKLVKSTTSWATPILSMKSLSSMEVQKMEHGDGYQNRRISLQSIKRRMGRGRGDTS